MTPIKCTGLKCPMQDGKVDPATCKAADTCKWNTKPLTNADRKQEYPTEVSEMCYMEEERQLEVIYGNTRDNFPR